MNKKVINIVLVVIVLLGGYFLFRSEPKKEVSDLPIETPEVKEESPEHTITYTNTGFSPNSLTIKTGDTVTFKNESTQSMWPASSMHPSHRDYSGTSLSEHCGVSEDTAFDACKGIQPDNSWSFTFGKVGAWKYHDHLHPELFGTIIVEE